MLVRANQGAVKNPVDHLAWPSAPVHRSGRYLGASVPDITGRCRLETPPVATASGLLNVERLLADLAARFVSIEPDVIDDTVADGLRKIAEALQLDWAMLWENGADNADAVTSHGWMKYPQPSPPEPLELRSLPCIVSKLEAGEAASFTRIDEVPDPDARAAFLRHRLQSAAIVPVASGGGIAGVSGVLAFGSRTEHGWTPRIIDQLHLVSSIFGQALARKASQRVLQRALDELHQLRERMTEKHTQSRPGMTRPESRQPDPLQAENVHLRREAQERLVTGIIIGQSPAVRRVLAQVEQVAATDSTVLLIGETGTGKELLAARLHELGVRRGRAMVRLNCSAIPATLLESELFGREKGAYTGALARQIGRFELADHSTIFLDEIGDLPADVQVKLLRVLEERQIERLGSPTAIHVDVRIVAATHRNLEQLIGEGAFREDLFYRLNVFPIQIPPLRDRVEDIPLLVWRFVDEFAKAFGKRIDTIPRENMAALQRYAWPGNIRELRNIVERAMIVATGSQLTIALPTTSGFAGRCKVTLADVEKDHIRCILESSCWRVRGLGGAAERLGLRPTTLETRMAKLGISRPKRT